MFKCSECGSEGARAKSRRFQNSTDRRYSEPRQGQKQGSDILVSRWGVVSCAIDAGIIEMGGGEVAVSFFLHLQLEYRMVTDLWSVSNGIWALFTLSMLHLSLWTGTKFLTEKKQFFSKHETWNLLNRQTTMRDCLKLSNFSFLAKIAPLLKNVYVGKDVKKLKSEP